MEWLAWCKQSLKDAIASFSRSLYMEWMNTNNFYPKPSKAIVIDYQ
ncbi:hypothetical protein H6F78_05645 [Coleofasciculus sp. FACHB-64]|nr:MULTISPECIES: hypothetical protein [unclassified Coleofasciculus]MBD1840368.1 hypothetical protein [Coleofasciculus sp. FACHB-501]MBD2045085.1 hypothetical protein [Coleofasciculus sp. FACHB-64]